jgi:hypothetical protein
MLLSMKRETLHPFKIRHLCFKIPKDLSVIFRRDECKNLNTSYFHWGGLEQCQNSSIWYVLPFKGAQYIFGLDNPSPRDNIFLKNQVIKPNNNARRTKDNWTISANLGTLFFKEFSFYQEKLVHFIFRK